MNREEAIKIFQLMKKILSIPNSDAARTIEGTCSLCGGKYPWQPNYCPNCGARMIPYKGGDSE